MEKLKKVCDSTWRGLLEAYARIPLDFESYAFAVDHGNCAQLWEQLYTRSCNSCLLTEPRNGL